MKTEVDDAAIAVEQNFSSGPIVAKLIINETQYDVLLASCIQPTLSLADAIVQVNHRASLNESPEVIGCLKIAGVNYLIMAGDRHPTRISSEYLDLLTDRELQISDFVARGYSNKEIAKKLGISEWTISTHLRRIYAKLNVCNRAAMVYKCFGGPENGSL